MHSFPKPSALHILSCPLGCSCTYSCSSQRSEWINTFPLVFLKKKNSKYNMFYRYKIMTKIGDL